MHFLLFVSSGQSNLLFRWGLYCIFMIAGFCTALYLYFLGWGGGWWVVEREKPFFSSISILDLSFISFEDQISQTGQEFCLKDGATYLQRARLWRNIMGLNLLVICMMKCYCSRGKLWSCLKNIFMAFFSYQHICCCLQH